MVRSKYLESSQKQLMIDIPGGLKVCLPCCLCTFDGSLLLKSDAHDKEACLVYSISSETFNGFKMHPFKVALNLLLAD
jgi:hypothetical protein